MSSAVFLGPQNATKSLAAGVSPQTPQGALTRPLARFKGAYFKGPTFKGRERQGRCAKMIYAPGAKNPARGKYRKLICKCRNLPKSNDT